MNRNSPESGKGTKRGRSNRKNALIHGVYSRDVILPFESREDFEVMHADLRLELRPDGHIEEWIVFDLAHLYFQRFRILKMWQAAAYNDPFIGDLIRSRKKSWSGIKKHLRNQGKSFRDVTEALAGFCAKLTAAAKGLAVDVISGGLGKSEIDSAERKLDAIKLLVEKSVLPLMRTLEQGPSADETLKRAYSPESVEPIIRLQRSLDAREANLLAKLVRLQEYKRLRQSSQNRPLLVGGGTR
jgi:hypothetical protein